MRRGRPQRWSARGHGGRAPSPAIAKSPIRPGRLQSPSAGSMQSGRFAHAVLRTVRRGAVGRGRRTPPLQPDAASLDQTAAWRMSRLAALGTAMPSYIIRRRDPARVPTCPPWAQRRRKAWRRRAIPPSIRLPENSVCSVAASAKVSFSPTQNPFRGWSGIVPAPLNPQSVPVSPCRDKKRRRGRKKSGPAAPACPQTPTKMFSP